MNAMTKRYKMIIAFLSILVFVCLFTGSFQSLFINFGVSKVTGFGVSAIVLLLFGVLFYELNKHYINKNQGWTPDRKVFYIVLGIEALIFVALRMLVFGGSFGYTDNLGELAMRAMIGQEGTLYSDYSSLDGVFSSLLSEFFKFLGNTYFALYFLQFLLMCLSYATILYGIYRISGELSTLIVGIGLATSPFCIKTMAYGNSFNLAMLLLGITIVILSVLICDIEKSEISYLKIGILSVVLGILYLNSESLLAFLIMPLLLMLGDVNKTDSERHKKCGVYILGVIITILVIVIISGCSGNRPLAYEFENVFANRLWIKSNSTSGYCDVVWYLTLLLGISYYLHFIFNKNYKIYTFTYIIIISGAQSLMPGSISNGALYGLMFVSMMAISGKGIEAIYRHEEAKSEMNEIIDKELEEKRRAFFENLEPEVVSKEVNIIGEWEEISVIDKNDSLTESVDEFEFEELTGNNEFDRSFDDLNFGTAGNIENEYIDEIEAAIRSIENSQSMPEDIKEPEVNEETEIVEEPEITILNENPPDGDVISEAMAALESLKHSLSNDYLADYSNGYSKPVDSMIVEADVVEDENSEEESLLPPVNRDFDDNGDFEFSGNEVVVDNEPDYVENINATGEAEPTYVDEHLGAFQEDKPEYEWDDATGEFVLVQKSEKPSIVEEVVSSQETLFDENDVPEEEIAQSSEQTEEINESVSAAENVSVPENVADNAAVTEKEVAVGSQPEPEGETVEELNFEDEPVEYIENPLPLPKKHEHREMDYGRVIPQSLMHYDYDVTPDKNHYDY